MSITTAPAAWMTLADVARLAQVQRPVVSMWRSRFADFPQPSGERGGHPVFAADEIGGWLRDTGHGNNPDALADCAVFALGGGAADLPTLTSLLALAAVTGIELADCEVASLVDLAAQVDPFDRFLRREIEALAPSAAGALGAEPERLHQVLAYADRLADAAYSPAAALTAVLDRQLRHAGAGRRTTAIGAGLQTLVATTVRALADALDLHPLSLVDASRGGTGLIEAAAEADESATVVMGDHPGEWARLTRRVIRSRGMLTQVCPTDDGLPVLGGPQLVVLQLPDGPRPSMSDRQILREVGELTLRMSHEQWALVVAPASALTDRLRDPEAERDRDDVLRSGRLRLALRLPGGLLPHRGQQRLGLWLLGAAHPDVPPDRRWTVVGDLRDVAIDEALCDEVSTDAVAALGDANVVRGHAFRHARLVSAPGLVASRGDLVTAAPVGSGLAVQAPGQAVLDIERWAEQAGVADLPVRAATSAADSPGATTTLGRAIETSLVRLLPGHRIREHDIFVADPHAITGVVVIGREELTGESRWGVRRIDRLQLHADYPAAQLTQPGDVVFCTSKRVTARVDRDGGCVVQSPAKVLRIRDECDRRGGLVPDALAADLVKQPVAARAYRSWTVRLVPRHQREALAGLADELARQQDDLRHRLEALEALRRALVDGVAAGAALLDPVAESPCTGDNTVTNKGE